MTTSRTSEEDKRPESGQSREPMPKGFWPIWTTVLLDLIGFGIALPVLGIYAQEKFNASGTMIGVLGASYSAATFLSAKPLGALSDRIGRKPILLFSLIGTAFAALMTGFASSLWALVAWRFADGLTGGSYGVAGAAIGDIAPPHRRAALLGMMGAAFGIGFTVGPAIGAVASQLGGQRAPFFLLAAMSALNAIAVLIRVKETKHLAEAQTAELEETESVTLLAHRWTDSRLPLFLVAGFLFAFAFSAFETHFSTFGRKELGLTRNNAGYALAVVGIVSSIVQGGLIGPVSKRVGNHRLMTLGPLGTALGLFLFGSASGWGLLLPSMVVLAVSEGFLSPSLSAEYTNRIAPSKRGSLLGTRQSLNSGASVVAPLLAGVAFDHISHASPFYIGAALYLIGFVLIAGVKPRSAGALIPRQL